MEAKRPHIPEDEFFIVTAVKSSNLTQSQLKTDPLAGGLRSVAIIL
jgi:hypothetical protein